MPNSSQSYKAKNTREEKLAEAFAEVSTKQDALNFLRDLLTPAELEEFSNRFEIARLLKEGNKSYLEIAKEVGTSTTTVTRVALWLKNGCGGYQKVLSVFNK